MLQTAIAQTLFPDNTYSKNSGGDPDHIPVATYEHYLDFYHKYYHPSNSYIYLYGDMDVKERLEWMDRAYLSAYESMEIDSNIPMQKPFDAMKLSRLRSRLRMMIRKKIILICPIIW